MSSQAIGSMARNMEKEPMSSMPLEWNSSDNGLRTNSSQENGPIPMALTMKENSKIINLKEMDAGISTMEISCKENMTRSLFLMKIIPNWIFNSTGNESKWRIINDFYEGLENLF